MHVGHLESAAGAVGLLKAMLMCEHGKVPAFRIDGKGLNPQVMAAMEGSCLCNPGQPGVLMADAMLGVSSFGFAGSNAHVVMTAPKGCPAAKYERPFTATLSKHLQIPLTELSTTLSPRGSTETFCLTSLPKQKDGDGGDQDVEDVSVSRLSFVSSAVLSIVGGESDVDADADLHELGVDSLGLAELLGLLEDGDCFQQLCSTHSPLPKIPKSGSSTGLGACSVSFLERIHGPWTVMDAVSHYHDESSKQQEFQCTPR